ncbi:hypothetical protein QTN25_009915 [Entamoeba marina]
MKSIKRQYCQCGLMEHEGILGQQYGVKFLMFLQHRLGYFFYGDALSDQKLLALYYDNPKEVLSAINLTEHMDLVFPKYTCTMTYDSLYQEFQTPETKFEELIRLTSLCNCSINQPIATVEQFHISINHPLLRSSTIGQSLICCCGHNHQINGKIYQTAGVMMNQVIGIDFNHSLIHNLYRIMQELHIETVKIMFVFAAVVEWFTEMRTACRTNGNDKNHGETCFNPLESWLVNNTFTGITKSRTYANFIETFKEFHKNATHGLTNDLYEVIQMVENGRDFNINDYTCESNDNKVDECVKLENKYKDIELSFKDACQNALESDYIPKSWNVGSSMGSPIVDSNSSYSPVASSLRSDNQYVSSSPINTKGQTSISKQDNKQQTTNTNSTPLKENKTTTTSTVRIKTKYGSYTFQVDKETTLEELRNFIKTRMNNDNKEYYDGDLYHIGRKIQSSSDQSLYSLKLLRTMLDYR